MRPGERVDRYLIEAELGRGGMGIVFEAVDTRLGRRVALKVIVGESDPLANERMAREARAAAALEHPNAVTVFDVGESDGSTFLAMELVRGRPLRALVGDATIPPMRRVRWIVDVARALGAAHRAGLVHRDVKPDNVMIREDGVVKVLDFGIARRQDAALDPSAPTEDGAIVALTERGLMVGTPLYASPEQLRTAPLDGRSDQFSWAVLAYEVLTGRPPWRLDGGSGALVAQIIADDAPSMRGVTPDMPEELDRAVLRALSKRPADRFPTIDDAADALEPFAETPTDPQALRRHGTLPPSASPPSATAPSARPPPVRTQGLPVGKVLLGLGCVGAVAIVLATAAVWWSVHAATRAVVIDRVTCADATVEGEAPGSLIPAAIGRGACIRLANGLGVEWDGKRDEDRLTVSAKLEAGAATVTLEIRGVKSTSSGTNAFAALGAALQSLEKSLAAPAPSTDFTRAWGAKDAASARRIEKALRRQPFTGAADLEREASAVAKADPRSAWAHALSLLVNHTISPAAEARRKEALKLVKTLPPAREHALRGTLLNLGQEGDRAEALRLLRLAYSEDPKDPDVAALYAGVALTRGLPDEGVAVIDRLCARSPSRCVVALEDAASRSHGFAFDKKAAFLEKLFALAPEMRLHGIGVRDLVEQGKIADARAMLELGERLGILGSKADPATYTRVFLELAAFEPTKARTLATSLLGDPLQSRSADGARAIIASYWMAGNVEDALIAEQREIQRQKQLGFDRRAVSLAIWHLRALRTLGRPVDEVLVTWAAEVVEKDSFSAPTVVAGRRARLALARADEREALSASLEELEAFVETSAGTDVNLRDSLRVATLPLVRRVRGDAAARALWKEAKRAPFSVRADWAFEAAIAFETGDDPAELARAYELAAHPANLETSALFVVAAHARLGRVYRAMGRVADAAREDALVQKAWGAAEPALRTFASRQD